MGPLIGAALIGGGSALLGGGISSAGAAKANKMNLKIAREQMAFQERMRNTEFQTAVKDMQLAGLNPALAYEKGGASSPSGASAQMENTLAAAGSSAAQAANLFSNISLQQATAKKTNAEADYVAAKAQAELALTRAQIQQTGMTTARAAQDLRYQEETFGTRSAGQLYETRLKQLEADYQQRSMASRLEAAGLSPLLMRQDYSLKELGRNEAEAWSKFYGSAGEMAPWLNSALDIVRAFTPLGKFFQKRPTTHIWKR